MPPFPIRTLAELAAEGVPPSTVRNRVRTGRYRRVLPGVIATAEPDLLALCYAATRWQPRAVLSHQTAAWLWGMAPAPELVEATVPRQVSVRPPEWLRLHRRALRPGWVTTYRTMVILTPERALVDVLGAVSPVLAEDLIDDAPAHGVNLTSARIILAQGCGRRGAPAARRALDGAAHGAESYPERVLGRELRRRGTTLQANRRVGRYRCDFVDVVSRTIVEIDGRAHHSGREVFAADRRRQNELLLDGWLVLRYAAIDVLGEPGVVADEIALVVRRRTARCPVDGGAHNFRDAAHPGPITRKSVRNRPIGSAVPSRRPRPQRCATRVPAR